MTKLIFIWIFQKLTYIAEALTPISSCLTIFSLLLAISLLIIHVSNDGEISSSMVDIIRGWRAKCMKVFYYSLIPLIGLISLKSVRLSETEYKAAIVYCVATEIMDTNAGTKVIDIVDAKLSDWLKMIQNSNVTKEEQK